MVEETQSSNSESFLTKIFFEIIQSPLNLILVVFIAILVYKIIKNNRPSVPVAAPPELPKLRKDFTVEELQPYNGTQPDGRILVAVNGNVYDVTKSRRFYGPGGPYAAFGGRDASRGFATFSVSTGTEYDDLSDLNTMEMDSVREWDDQFKEKYDLVGRLLKPGEAPTNYSDEEDEEKEKKVEEQTSEKEKEKKEEEPTSEKEKKEN